MRGRIVKVAVTLCGLGGAVYAADQVTAPPETDLNRAIATQMVNEGQLANALPNAPADSKYTSEQMMILAPKYAADMETAIEHAAGRAHHGLPLARHHPHDLHRRQDHADEDPLEPRLSAHADAAHLQGRADRDADRVRRHQPGARSGERARRPRSTPAWATTSTPCRPDGSRKRTSPPPTSTTRPVRRCRFRPSTAPPRRALTTERAGRVNLPAVYAPLSRFLLRAPLLPTASLARAARALTAHPLGAAAIAVASPTLAGAAAGPARERSITRYARRAAFRATPSGLLAGVCVGELGPKTEIATGSPAPHLAPSWARVDALARRCSTTRRFAIGSGCARPRRCRRTGAVRWIGGRGEPFDGAVQRRPRRRGAALAAVLTATTDWAPWPAVLRACRKRPSRRPDDLDELLLALVDDGLLQTDLSPPLIGPPPASYLRDRLAALGRAAPRRARSTRPRPPSRPAISRAAARSGRALPGRCAARDLHGRADPASATDAAARTGGRRARGAAGPAALPAAGGAGPARSRSASARAPGATPSTRRPRSSGPARSICGARRRRLRRGRRRRPTTAPTARSPRRSAGAAGAPARRDRRGRAHASGARRRSSVTALEAALADLEGTPLPPTAELFLVPAPRPPGRPAGTGWLLGLHAPAGASLGALRPRARRAARRRLRRDRRRRAAPPAGRGAGRRRVRAQRGARRSLHPSADPPARAGAVALERGRRRSRRRAISSSRPIPPTPQALALRELRARPARANDRPVAALCAHARRRRRPGSRGCSSGGACSASTPPGPSRRARSPSWRSFRASSSTGS